MRKEALDSAVLNLDRMHELAQKQKDLLEEEAFVSVGIDLVYPMIASRNLTTTS